MAALTYRSSVKESVSSGPGTGTLTLTGAITGYQAFNTRSGLDGATVSMRIEAVDANNNANGLWEESRGVYTASGTTLTRVTVTDGSSGPGTKVNFAGACNVMIIVDETAVNQWENLVSPTGHIYGFQLAYTGRTTITVGRPSGTAGVCRDSTDTTVITLSSQSTVTVNTTAAINGNDSFTGTGTVTCSLNSASLTGSGTAFTTVFAPGGTPRALSGTCSSSLTTVTGTNTFFLSQIAVGDLIGNATKGYSRVTLIASDTSLTVIAAPPGGAFSGSSVNCIENPIIKAGTRTSSLVDTITSDTALVMTTATGAAQTGTAFTVGESTTSPTIGWFMYAWVGTGGTGTGCYVSTQRTTPFGITGYNTYFRRVGSLMLTASNAIAPFSQSGISNERKYQYELAIAANGTGPVSATVSNGTWTSAVASGCCPPSASVLLLALYSASAGNIYLRQRGVGSATATRNLVYSGNAVINLAECICDGSQGFDFSGSGAAAITISLSGYKEYL